MDLTEPTSLKSDGDMYIDIQIVHKSLFSLCSVKISGLLLKVTVTSFVTCSQLYIELYIHKCLHTMKVMAEEKVL